MNSSVLSASTRARAAAAVGSGYQLTEASAASRGPRLGAAGAPGLRRLVGRLRGRGGSRRGDTGWGWVGWRGWVGGWLVGWLMLVG